MPSTKQNTTLVKMPTLELPDFYRDLMKWPEFWQLWYDVYHTENQLTPVQKFRYLLCLALTTLFLLLTHVCILLIETQIETCFLHLSFMQIRWFSFVSILSFVW